MQLVVSLAWKNKYKKKFWHRMAVLHYWLWPLGENLKIGGLTSWCWWRSSHCHISRFCNRGLWEKRAAASPLADLLPRKTHKKVPWFSAVGWLLRPLNYSHLESIRRLLPRLAVPLAQLRANRQWCSSDPPRPPTAEKPFHSADAGNRSFTFAGCVWLFHRRTVATWASTFNANEQSDV